MIEKHFRKAYAEWRGKDGYVRCPKCNSVEVAHIVIAYEGDMLLCKNCKYKQKIGEEDRKIRKGLTL